ncbi:hypothetical protein [Novipirellula sp.]|uniref:hypothetical protein n=1 Tax=Novipirellula sp. TaxID=2795430 RepID=UPI00356395FF
MQRTTLRRVAGRDLVLVAISSFVLAIHWLPVWLPVAAKTESFANSTLPVAMQVAGKPVAGKSVPAAITPVSADEAVARWQSEVTQFYATQSQAKVSPEAGNAAADIPSKSDDANEIAQTSFVTTAAEDATEPAATDPPLQSLSSAPALPVNSGHSARLAGETPFRSQSVVFAFLVTTIVSLLFAAWCVAFPTRPISPVMWASRSEAGDAVDASQSLPIGVDANWFTVTQPILVRTRQICFAALVMAAMLVCIA